MYYSKLRAPICFNPVASRTVLPLHELRTKVGMEGKTPDQIAERVQAAYAKGELPKMEAVVFSLLAPVRAKPEPIDRGMPSRNPSQSRWAQTLRIPQRRLQIWMVAAYSEVTEAKRILVAEARYVPNLQFLSIPFRSELIA